MNDSLKDKLIKVTPDKLVDLIFDLASENDVAWSKIERLVSKPTDNSKRFIRRLEDIKNRGGFIPWKYSSQFGDELSDLLADLESGVSSPEEGFSLICEFYKSDSYFFKMADDSSGYIGDVFRNDAINVFVNYASLISDKKLIIHQLLELLKDDGYGVRDELIQHVGKFLSEPDLRNLFKIVEQGDGKGKGYDSWKLKALAKQLKDAPLFEKMSRRGIEQPNSRTLVEIAEVYFLSNDLEKAQEILNSNKLDDHFGRHEHEDLQKKIYARIGKSDELLKIVYAAFQRNHSEYTLKDLITVAGEDRRHTFIKEAVDKIVSKNKWNDHDADFLKFVDDTESLKKIILNHRVEIQEGVYYSAADLVEYLVRKNKPLAAAVLCRGLINKTLEKSIAKYYRHAVNYLEILDQISPGIKFWDGIDDHLTYMLKLKKTHALKKSLWSQYKK